MIVGEGQCLQNRPIPAVVICVDVTAVTDSGEHQENSTALQLLIKMRGLLFLLSALFLLESTKGLKYEELNEDDRKIVDGAIKQGNKMRGTVKHLDFYSITTRGSALEVILRPTSCDKTTPSVHRKECEVHNKQPQVSCIHCNGIMKPCLLFKQKEKKEERINECQKYLPGSGFPFF
ncbi:cystatin-like protein [Carassius carassius]|uniref:cystatin-like protein n=1 Tax=Carassius carassius TaxID=217509 RepID=UPI002868CA33|nr:cystatin-like protein [Carassius carassius]